MGKKGKKALIRLFFVILVIFISPQLISADCGCNGATPYCQPGACTLGHYDPLTEITYPDACSTCQACPSNNCADETTNKICSGNICIRCTEDSHCSSLGAGYTCSSCSNTCLTPTQTECCGGVSPEECGGSTDSGDGGNYTQFLAKYFWNKSHDADPAVQALAAYAFNLQLDNHVIEYIGADGLRYSTLIPGEPAAYNCNHASNPDCLASLKNPTNTPADEKKLCSIEGDYYGIFYTDKTPVAGGGTDGVRMGAGFSSPLKVYNINAQDSEDICACISNALDPANPGYLYMEQYTLPSNVFPRFNWNQSAKTVLGFSCCGPAHTTDSLAPSQDAIQTSCEIDSASRYLCDNRTGKHPNEWHIASIENLGCAYNTSCGYWILSTPEASAAKWLKCDASLGNNPNMGIFRVNPPMGSWDIIALNSSFACFNTNDKKEEYRIYECAQPLSSSAEVACKSGADDAKKIRAGKDSLNRILDSAYVNTTLDGTKITTYYCGIDGFFADTLDGSSDSTYALVYSIKKATCLADGFSWTGSKCCGDFDQKNGHEFYNDDSINPLYCDRDECRVRKAGCWDSTAIFSGNTLDSGAFPGGILNPYNTKSIINYNGTFFGCNLSSTSQFMTTIVSSYTLNPIIKKGNNVMTGYPTATFDEYKTTGATNLETCQILVNASLSNSYYCSADNNWTSAERNVARMKQADIRPDLTAPASTLLQKECCPSTRCWNGTVCINSSEQNSRMGPAQGVGEEKEVQGNYVCVEEGIDAHWSNFTGYKYDWNHIYVGICSKKTQCLIDRNGQPDLSTAESYYQAKRGEISRYPKCLDSSEYVDDHYCNEGNWTSRTKLIAEQLLQGAGSSYTLFCDNASAALNKVNYMVGPTAGAVLVKSHLDTNTNNICVLKDASNNLIFGVSLNKPINESGLPEILNLPNTPKNYCVGVAASNPGGFLQCSSTATSPWNVLYNRTTRLAIFTNANFNTAASPAKFEVSQGTNAMILAITGSSEFSSGNRIDPLNLTHDFSKIYAANINGKRIVGFREKNAGEEYLAVKYAGFSAVDICMNVDNYYASRGYSGGSDIFCAHPDSSNHYVFGSDALTMGSTLLDAWTDLTAKTRVKS